MLSLRFLSSLLHHVEKRRKNHWLIRSLTSYSRQEEIRNFKAAINEQRANLLVSVNTGSRKPGPQVAQLATSLGTRFLVEDIHHRTVIPPETAMENEVSMIYIEETTFLTILAPSILLSNGGSYV